MQYMKIYVMAPRLLLAQSRHFDAKIAYQKKTPPQTNSFFLLYVYSG